MIPSTTHKIFSYSAPGKTILSGEHSVVYFKNALVMAIDLRTYSSVSIFDSIPNKKFFSVTNKQDVPSSFELEASELVAILKVLIEDKELHEFSVLHQKFAQIPEKLLILAYVFLRVFIEAAKQTISQNEILNIFEHKLISSKQVHLNIYSTLPISKGLGSSASFFAALTASFLGFAMNIFELKEIEGGFKEFVNKQAYGFEKIYHGTPSGIDNHIATYGGMLLFNKKHQENLKVKSFPYKIVLIDSEIEKSTKKAVSRVRQLYEDTSLKTIGKQAVDMIGDITDQIVSVMTVEEPFNIDHFENLIRANQSLLRLLDVSHSSIEEIMGISMKYGIPAKITGAGQGGNCIAFIPNGFELQKERAFEQELKSKGFSLIEAHLSIEGVKEETIIEQISNL